MLDTEAGSYRRTGGLSITREASPQRPGGLARFRGLRAAVGLAALAIALWWLTTSVEWSAVPATLRAVADSPGVVAAGLVCYAAAFALRAGAWRAVQPSIPFGHGWAAIHVALVGNHLLPFRLGEPLRVTSALRRCDSGVGATTRATISLRAGDLIALLALGAIAAPSAVTAGIGWWQSIALAGALLVLIGVAWSVLRSRDDLPVPPPRVAGAVVVATVAAWVLEASVLYAVARAAGLPLGFTDAVGVTAVTILAQVVAVAPGGAGTYEAAGTAALVGLGFGSPVAFAVVLTTHLVKTAYSLVLGPVALVAPAPGYWGRWRLPRTLPPRPARTTVPGDAPVVVFLPAHDEEATVGDVVGRIPGQVAGRRIVVVVVDDGSSDDTAARAEAAGANVIRLPENRGLGAAVREGMAAAVGYGAAAGVYLDADGEYRPEDIDAMVAPVLDRSADYVVGSRFAGRIESMRTLRRIGNRLLTIWVRWMTRRRDITDGQSGFRAFSPGALAAAEIVHDYNYAQVLTLDLLAKGFAYDEVPIGYSFRRSGRSFVSLGRYLRRVVPATHREINGASGPQRSSVLDHVTAE